MCVENLTPGGEKNTDARRRDPGHETGRCLETEHLPCKGSWEERQRKAPRQGERSGRLLGLPRLRAPVSLLLHLCGFLQEEKVLSLDTQGARLNRAAPGVTLGCE